MDRNVQYIEGFCVARLLHFNDWELQVAKKSHWAMSRSLNSDVSTQSWALISENDDDEMPELSELDIVQ